MAQRLLIERSDKSVQSALTDLARKGVSNLARFHALWTLDGLKMSSPDLLFAKLADADPLVSSTALRLLEPFAKADKAVRTKLGEQLLNQWEKAPIEQVLQMTLTAGVLDPSASHRLLAGIVNKYGESALIRDAALSSLYNQEFAFLQTLLTSPQWQTQEPPKEIFLEMLTTSVIRKRNPTELAALLNRLNVNKTAMNWQEKAMLTSLTIQGSTSKLKPVKLAAAPKILTQPTDKIDPDRLATLSSMFEWPGHVANKTALPKKSLLNDDEQKLFASGRQIYLSTCSGCHGTDGAGLKRFAPPLIGSDWVLGDEKRLSLIVLHGMEGPVEVARRVYDVPDILPVMPSHSTMDDGSITAILMYIRNEWGNNAGPIGKRVVGMTRVTSQGRVVPWTAKELNNYISEGKATSGK